MKKIMFIFSLGILLAACGNQNNQTPAETTTPATTSNPTDAATAKSGEAAKGYDLISKNDCLTCHKINETVSGPAYIAVANRYTATPEVIDTLSNKIIHGGSGKWGAIPMTPHPQLSKEDAQTMVKYILSLKK